MPSLSGPLSRTSCKDAAKELKLGCVRYTNAPLHIFIFYCINSDSQQPTAVELSYPDTTATTQTLSKCLDLVSHGIALFHCESDHQPNAILDEAQNAQQQLYDDQGNPTQPDNQGSFGHEVLAAGAGFMAMRQYQKHEEANGSSTPPSLSSLQSYSPSHILCLHTRSLLDLPNTILHQVSPRTTP